MSLRVLLADESASIKKVFQLGLQDFAAEVKTVQSGVDVLEVAESYNPDIIFADILLQKKNGYEVCKELKKHATLKTVPVVLMWSSFMELDHQKYQESEAEGEMEKPFEVDAMRSHIQNLVQKTKTQQLSSFLKFPNAIKEDFIQEFEEQKENFLSNPPPAEASEQAPPMEEIPNVIIPPAPQAPSVDGVELSATPLQENQDEVLDEVTQNSVFNQSMDDFSAELEIIEEDEEPPVMPQALEAPTPEVETAASENIDEEDGSFELTHNEVAVEEWRTKSLSDSNLAENETEDDGDEDQFKSVELKADENLDLDDFLYKPDEMASVDDKPPIVEVRTLDYSEEDNLTPVPESTKTASSINVDRGEIEAIVLAHAQEIIKMNIQEMLPQIIEKITREELEKLLKEELKMKS